MLVTLASFALRSNVTVTGGYAGRSAANPDARDVTGTPTVLLGNIGASTPLDNSYHVVTGNGVDTTAVLDGVTISGGYVTGSDDDGGGGGEDAMGRPPTGGGESLLLCSHSAGRW